MDEIIKLSLVYFEIWVGTSPVTIREGRTGQEKKNKTKGQKTKTLKPRDLKSLS